MSAQLPSSTSLPPTPPPSDSILEIVPLDDIDFIDVDEVRCRVLLSLSLSI
jgi:hypothetical protein